MNNGQQNGSEWSYCNHRNNHLYRWSLAVDQFKHIDIVKKRLEPIVYYMLLHFKQIDVPNICTMNMRYVNPLGVQKDTQSTFVDVS